MATEADARFVEDVLSCIGSKPVLVNDVVARLRHAELPSKRSWKNVRVEVVEGILRSNGACLGFRTHGAGIAIYVAAAAFREVQTRHGMRPVRPY
jgi:hypothetical protein